MRKIKLNWSINRVDTTSVMYCFKRCDVNVNPWNEK